MNRSNYFSYIEEKLIILAHRIEVRGKMNILDLHIYSESFYLHFLNLVFDWQLRNLNVTKQNAEAIDLIDDHNRVILQVSATATKQKVDSALTKDLSAYTAFIFKFISICRDAADLRTKTFTNPHNLRFEPSSDILDVPFLLREILAFDIEKQKTIKEFLKKELALEVDAFKMDSNLAAIINTLSKEDFDSESPGFQLDPFAIESKIEYNTLDTAKTIIDDFKIYHGRLDKIYTEFDKQGVNKSGSVLRAIRKEYILNKKAHSGDELFFKICDSVTGIILNSSNFAAIPFEELDLCVNTLVVDAFIRCKIFENPENAKNAST